MDPNKTLDKLRRAIEGLPDHDYHGKAGELFEALDEWLTAGGFLPDDWARDPRTNYLQNG